MVARCCRSPPYGPYLSGESQREACPSGNAAHDRDVASRLAGWAGLHQGQVVSPRRDRPDTVNLRDAEATAEGERRNRRPSSARRCSWHAPNPASQREECWAGRRASALSRRQAGNLRMNVHQFGMGLPGLGVLRFGAGDGRKQVMMRPSRR